MLLEEFQENLAALPAYAPVEGRTTTAGDLLNGRHAGLRMALSTCSLSTCASADGSKADLARCSFQVRK